MKISIKFLAPLVIGVFFAGQIYGQGNNTDPVTYEELYDDPESIRKLFVGFQPLYGELWATNPNAGFGLDAIYYLKKAADFRVHVRKTYAAMFDTYLQSAINNSHMDNEPYTLTHFEGGGSYHFKEELLDGETKMVLYKRNYRGSRWAAQVPMTIVVPSKVRRIMAARLGGIYYQTSTDLDRILERQGLSKADLLTPEGLPMPEQAPDALGNLENINVYGNISTGGFYTGVSMSWFRNVAVKIDKHEPGIDDHLMTAYADLLIMPFIGAENVFYQDQEYLVDNIATTMIGFRVGMEGRFNRMLSWGYGGEIGYKPGYKSGGLSILLKLSLPVFGTDLDYNVESFAK
ncbi:MAG: hypothetical protein OEW75_15970 [Cyclobacteriaceae bacterium]|nr:hypothetical protein [Cyclobacteriaceae bacterium]